MNEPFEILSERQVYKRYISVVDRRVKFPPNGREVAWETCSSISELSDLVTVVAFHSSDKTMTIIREYCQGPNMMVYALVGGQFHKSQAKSKLECAQHELSEEGHLKGGRWLSLLPEGHPGIPELKWCSNLFIPFLVIDPEQDTDPMPRDEEELIEIHRLPIKDIRQMILKGEMMLPSAQTFWMACEYLKNEKLIDAEDLI